MDPSLMLVAAGAFAGFMNATAGGGSFITLPALALVGVPALLANTSSTVALFPGAVASAAAYRSDIAPMAGLGLGPLLLVSVVGGGLGSVLLLATSERAFEYVVPWLLLIATLVFAGSLRRNALQPKGPRLSRGAVLGLQFALAIYGGYFGGALGIMTMALWSVSGESDMRVMNATKTLVVGATNFVAVVFFLLAAKVKWPETLYLLVSAGMGGYVGARVARRIPSTWLRRGTIAFGAVMTCIFFARQWR